MRLFRHPVPSVAIWHAPGVDSADELFRAGVRALFEQPSAPLSYVRSMVVRLADGGTLHVREDPFNRVTLLDALRVAVDRYFAEKTPGPIWAPRSLGSPFAEAP